MRSKCGNAQVTGEEGVLRGNGRLVDPLYATSSPPQPYLMERPPKYFSYQSTDENDIRIIKSSVVAVLCKIEIIMENAALKFSFPISVETTQSQRDRNQVLAHQQ